MMEIFDVTKDQLDYALDTSSHPSGSSIVTRAPPNTVSNSDQEIMRPIVCVSSPSPKSEECVQGIRTGRHHNVS